jgi:hypothetical protein
MVMTPTEKAQELYQRYHALGSDFTRGVSMHEFAKQCALITVDEILNAYIPDLDEREYWVAVRNELMKL